MVQCAGNFEYDARPSEIEKLFSEFGRVERVDMKMGMFLPHGHPRSISRGPDSHSSCSACKVGSGSFVLYMTS